MPMKSPNKIMGKVKSPSFFKGSTSQSSGKSKATPLKRNMPVLLALVLVGVAIILYLRSRSTGTSMTGPLVQTGIPSEQSNISSILASQGQVATNPTNPSGGATTPIAPVPTGTTPGSGTPSNPIGAAGTGSSAFMRTYGDSPTNIYDATIAKIFASGHGNTGTPAEWERLFKQYGGDAGLAAWQVMFNVPSPTQQVAGIPTSGPSQPSAGATGTANSFFTGVTTTTTDHGMVSQFYRDGQLIGTEVNAADPNALAGSKYGLNTENWYA